MSHIYITVCLLYYYQIDDYIENGELKYPISETMISGNIQEMFSNIGEISSDLIDFGYCIFPWISFKGVTVS